MVYTDILSSSLHKRPVLIIHRELVARTEVGIIYVGGISCLADLAAIYELNVMGGLLHLPFIAAVLT